MLKISYELFIFFSSRRRVLIRLLLYFRPAPLFMTTLMLLSSNFRNYIYASVVFYASFISLIFSIYRFPSRLSMEAKSVLLLELVYQRRYEALLSRLVATYLILFIFLLFPMLSLFSVLLPILGYRFMIDALVISIITPLFSLASASLGLLFFRQSGNTAAIYTYTLIALSVVFPYLIYMTSHNPRYLIFLILSPGFSPAIAERYLLLKLGARGIINNIRLIYATYRGLNAYYPGFSYAITPSLLYLMTSLSLFYLRFRNADL